MMTTKRIPALLTLAVLLPLAALAQPRQNNLTVVPPPARIVSPVIDGARTTFSIAALQAITVSLHGSWMNPDDNCYGPLVQDTQVGVILTENGMPHTFYTKDGGHTWSNWRIFLNEMLPLLF